METELVLVANGSESESVYIESNGFLAVFSCIEVRALLRTEMTSPSPGTHERCRAVFVDLSASGDSVFELRRDWYPSVVSERRRERLRSTWALLGLVGPVADRPILPLAIRSRLMILWDRPMIPRSVSTVTGPWGSQATSWPLFVEFPRRTELPVARRRWAGIATSSTTAV